MNQPIKIARLKNLFIAKELDAPHFRRLMLNIGPVLENGEVFIGECQIHIREIFEFKQTRGDLMHGPYEYFRSIYKDSEVAMFMKTLDLFDTVVTNPLLFAMLIVVVESITDERGQLVKTLPSTTAELYLMSIDAVLKRPLPQTAIDVLRQRSSLAGGEDRGGGNAKLAHAPQMIRRVLSKLAEEHFLEKSREFAAASFGDEARAVFAAFAPLPPPFQAPKSRKFRHPQNNQIKVPRSENRCILHRI